MIKVVVVDDSAFMRKAISSMLEKDPEITVVDTARDGEDGVEKVRRHDPDVVTMDIEMPRMDGLTALRRIMMEMPRPVLMISSLTTEGAEATLKAMEYGAVDYISKKLSMVSLDIVRIEDELRAKVKAVAKRKIRPTRLKARATTVRMELPSERPAGRQTRDVVAIGVSTGGPPAVQKILNSLPAEFPAPILIAQHMPKAFTGPFAKRLDTTSPLKVKEAETGDALRPGYVYISPGGSHLIMTQRKGRLEAVVTAEPADALYKPSANVLVSSVASSMGSRALAVILTGMGSDGAEGVKDLKAKGGRALAQSDASCVVYGMPKAIVDANLADEVVDLDDMAQAMYSSLFK
ncbi:MAG: chemotaxis response regulator protein-glutamate methylesterase [Deltaproteobacteria bacterium]|nr:chemotaxis response regulator protein-glutamate methylesterase [Deltaproteobacteria bacterium]